MYLLHKKYTFIMGKIFLNADKQKENINDLESLRPEINYVFYIYSLQEYFHGVSLFTLFCDLLFPT